MFKLIARCADGFYGSPSEVGGACVPCDCNPTSSFNNKCDKRTGQCLCLEGITGRTCDKCQPRYALDKGKCVCKSKGNHSNYDMTFVLKTSLLLLPKILPFWGKILQFQSLILFQYSLMTLFTPNFAMPMDN